MPAPDSIHDPVAVLKGHFTSLRPAPRILEPDPPYPLHALPPLVAKWLAAHSSAADVPVSLTATPFLALVGATVGRQLRLAVGPGWYERPALWTALITLTGIGKTPAIGIARLPFDVLHNEQWTRWRAETDRWRRRGRRLPGPGFDRLLVHAGSVASLTNALQHSTGLALLRDELYGLVRAMDRRGGEDRQHYLSLWSSEPILPDRPELAAAIPHPVVGIVGGLQPTLLHRIRRKDQDGFLERFLLVFAAGHLPRLDLALPALPELEPVVDWLRPLRAIAGAADVPAGLTVVLSPEANARWVAWRTEYVDLSATTSVVLGGFYRKLPSHLARLALVLHALWHPNDPAVPLSGETMARAVDLLAYYRVHIHRALPLIGAREPLRSPEASLAERILHKLAAAGADAATAEPDGWLPRTRLLMALGRPETGAANDVIAALIDKGLIETRTVRTGGRPATHYRLAQ